MDSSQQGVASGPRMTKKPNILLITADDMNWDAVGAYGCPVAGTTPNIDRLAASGVCFNHAHVTIAVCQPSRSTLMTGRYPHRSGGEGFHNLRTPDLPILPERLRTGGYQVGILGKVDHSTPYCDFQWDMTYDQDDLGHGRSPKLYGRHTAEFLQQAKEAGRPFFLMVNSHDPHRPFYGNDNPEWYEEVNGPVAEVPSRTFTPDEITTPGCLADLPDVRLEISEYYNSVRRCDDTVGAVLRVLREAGCEQNTIVVFLSDNGMAFPFAKTNCYLNSTRTPLIMRWPGTIDPGSCDTEHLVSGIDLMPTLLEAAGVNTPSGMDGRSFLPLLRGDSQDDRDLVFTQFHQTAAKRNYPMRCVQNRRFGYIFNAWSNGVRVFQNESQVGRTMQAMRVAAETDPLVGARVDLFLHRVLEEFYDFESDPDAICNLIDDPEYASEIQHLRDEMSSWMERTEDPSRTAFDNRDDQAALDQLMEQTARELGGES
jgi:N-sulfoglucosamine sulfohydrolase